MTIYTMQTRDEQEFKLAISSSDIARFIYEWESLMRSACKHESGRLYEAFKSEDPMEEMRELWYRVKDEHDVNILDV